MTPPPAPSEGLQRAPLDTYKQIAVVRNANDTVVYQDSQGKLQRITGLGNEAISAVSDCIINIIDCACIMVI